MDVPPANLLPCRACGEPLTAWSCGQGAGRARCGQCGAAYKWQRVFGQILLEAMTPPRERRFPESERS